LCKVISPTFSSLKDLSNSSEEEDSDEADEWEKTTVVDPCITINKGKKEERDHRIKELRFVRAIYNLNVGLIDLFIPWFIMIDLWIRWLIS
jgi:hypothetical protein